MQRVLVKAAPGLAVSRLSFGAAPVEFKATRLFESIEAQPALGAAAGEVWHILTPPLGFAEANGWDICHSLMRDGFGVAGAPAPAFAEPDIEQRWITGKSTEGGQSLVQPCGAPDPQNPDFPRDIGNNYWFRTASAFAIQRRPSTRSPGLTWPQRSVLRISTPATIPIIVLCRSGCVAISGTISSMTAIPASLLWTCSRRRCPMRRRTKMPSASTQ